MIGNGRAGGYSERRNSHHALCHTEPISTYLFAFAAGPFEGWGFGWRGAAVRTPFALERGRKRAEEAARTPRAAAS